MRDGQIDVSQYDDPADLVAQLREVNERPDPGFVWFLTVGSQEEDPTLVVGVRGEVGALAWYDDDGCFVPVDGLNEDHAEYWLWAGHEAPMRPHSEVPVDRVYAAVEELVRTHQRPLRIEWELATTTTEPSIAYDYPDITALPSRTPAISTGSSS
ncbi:MAG TPA: Imm1 family immunity protein [Pseudonocardiaceae bacterium]|jgi:hypothetical protein|nr:Imm1 family immunity protein [Pseudonocardiaceae bacterium]